MMAIRREWVRGAAAFLAWSAVFAVIYAQSPLYTSNQNTYFLHGLAQAGIGQLSRDWLANTLDPLPLFSFLVKWTLALAPSGTPFYFYYALLMGVYLTGALGIVDALFDLNRSPQRRLAFLLIFLAVHSAAFHFLLSRATDAETPFLLEGGVAYQRLLGQVFQPSTFGVFLVLSLCIFLRGRPFLALLPLAAAVYFHPVYLLTGALLVLAFMWCAWREARNWRQPMLLGGSALLIVAPSVAYTAYAFWPTTPEIVARANEVLVTYRIPHHTLVSYWLDWTVIVQSVIILAALLVVRKTRLFPILAVLTAGTLILSAIQIVTGSYTLALLYPWRTSVLLVPVSTTVLLAFGLTRALDLVKARPPLLIRWAPAISLTLIAGLLAIGWIRFQIETGRQQADDGRGMMAFVAAHRAAEDTYLIPPKMRDFRLATGMPVFIDSFSIPYHDVDILEWYRRVRRADLFYARPDHTCEVLAELLTARAIDRVVFPADQTLARCGTYPIIYRDPQYVIYALK